MPLPQDAGEAVDDEQRRGVPHLQRIREEQQTPAERGGNIKQHAELDGCAVGRNGRRARGCCRVRRSLGWCAVNGATQSSHLGDFTIDTATIFDNVTMSAASAVWKPREDHWKSP